MRFAWVVVCLSLALAACTSGGSSSTPSPKIDKNVTIVAGDRLFDLDTIRVPAGSRVSITLKNLDADPHNIAMYKSEAAEEEIYVSETIAGRGTETKGSFPAPPPGKYFFRCDVHPVTMFGSFIVE